MEEYSLFPSLSWTSPYHFTNTLALRLYDNAEDNGINQSPFHQLTTALHEIYFTAIGLPQTLNRLVAQKANRFSINHYDHAMGRYMEDTVLEEDEDLTLN